MSPSSPVVNLALIGNPNTGKSCLFSALVGVQQRIGNYPGVTVERKTGRFATAGRRYDVVDLPGLYSLAPRSLDEMVVLDALLGRMADVPPVDAIVCIVDASNLQRNLYLAGQVLELGWPTVIVLNKLDLAEARGVHVDVPSLAERLGVPVVATQANRAVGIDELKDTLDRLDFDSRRTPESVFPESLETEASQLAPLLETLKSCTGCRLSPRWLARRLLLDASGFLEGALLGECPGRHADCRQHRDGGGCGGRRRRRWGWGRSKGRVLEPTAEKLRVQLDAARRRLVEAGCPLPGIEPECRYAWAARVLDGVANAPARRQETHSDRLDRVLTHPVGGLAVFALVMFVVFQAVFSWAAGLMEFIITAFDRLGDALTTALAGTSLAGGAVESLLVRGVLGGVGSVLSFLPQILILFLFIALLEQCGYMARAAYLMDRLMARVGLGGQAFIPLLCSFACAVPGIMATRVISDPRTRLTTMLVAPLMTCSARLPIYALLIAAFVPSRTYLGLVNLQGLTLLSLYVLGVVAAILAALILKWTVLPGPPTPLLMEMPAYEWPSPRVVAMRVLERGWIFVRTAGTVILLVSIVAWAALYYPRPASIAASFAPRRAAIESSLARLAPTEADRTQLDAQRAEIDFQRDKIEADLARLDAEQEAAYQRQSVLARLGRAIEPAVRPLGWDWRIGSAVLASFPQREAVVATLGVIFSRPDASPASESTLDTAVHDAAGDRPAGDDEASLRARLRAATWEGTDRQLFTLPAALSIMVFYALCIQCVATLAVIRRETGGWRWPAFTFAYLTTAAYLGALATYQLGTWIAG